MSKFTMSFDPATPNSYILFRDNNGVLEVINSRTVPSQLEFRQEVENMCKYFNVPKMTWLFFYEGEEHNAFEIEAQDSGEAYDIAYERYGPQVEDMLYKFKLTYPTTGRPDKI